jgi:hypothetical protein
MLSTWEQKDQSGAERLACMACGAHTLVVDQLGVTICNCCGGFDLRPVAMVEANRHASRARRHAARGVARRSAVRLR